MLELGLLVVLILVLVFSCYTLAALRPLPETRDSITCGRAVVERPPRLMTVTAQRKE